MSANLQTVEPPETLRKVRWFESSMDLTKEYPRSAKEKKLGLVSLARVIDKASALNGGKLGEYDYDCPHDKPLFEFLAVDGPTFAKKVADLKTDDAILDWVKSGTAYAKKTPQEIAAFNERRENWRPEPGSHAAEFFESLREQVAPGRKDVKTWFDVLDLDEKRPVPTAHP
jgi:hypothetical protein